MNTCLKNIFKRLGLEVSIEKLLYNVYSAKVASGKCSVKKVFLVVDRAVKVTCFYIDQHLS